MGRTPRTNRLTPRAIELKKDVAIVVCGASGDLAKKKTVRLPWERGADLVSCFVWIGMGLLGGV
jgi:hypothetical protein